MARGLQGLSYDRLVALLALVFALLAASAMLRTSATFDEIVFPAAGARALHTGDFSMIDDHPRLVQYLFGAPAYLATRNFPREDRGWEQWQRYAYARILIWGPGNTPDRLILSARLVGLAFGVLTVLATFAFARRHMPEGAAAFAALLVAFLPDVLAHSGVAYNDIPLAFGVLASVYALDAFVRDPRPARAALAALACAFACTVKYSGLAVFAVGAALLAMEALSGRGGDAGWRRRMASALGVFALVLYAAMVVAYAGDWALAEYRGGVGLLLERVGGREAFLLGETRVGGWWYFFPVALLLKTPAALHVLALAALAAAAVTLKAGLRREALLHGARAPIAGALIIGGALLGARFNIGTRHALPLMPLVCILVAQGAALWWARGARFARGALVAMAVLFVASTARAYPHFLSYLTEYTIGRPLHEVLVDSNTDWGQGLISLGDFMRERRIAHVELGYFGTAMPEGYGVHYVPAHSFFDLPQPSVPARERPRYLVVSATLLAGLYGGESVYGGLRKVKPLAILGGGTLYVFDRGPTP
jgi:dolichyl-phosphate-mannose-protein mannosyltransferase